MPDSSSALVLANDHFQSVFAKTAHGMVRGPSRFAIAGVIDATHAGLDAGAVLDGRARGIPFFSTIEEALDRLEVRPTHCVVGVATVGGVLPSVLRADLITAAKSGLTLVNGLHQLLSDDAELSALASGGIIDVRRPRPASALRFWSGEVLSVPAPRLAVLGTDCAVGKRTTAIMIHSACRERGVRAEMVYTGQTGWLQGIEHGFIFDATLNDFVSGELEGAILACYRATEPDLIILEGQSALRNPSGPAGAELICSGAASGVVLQHAPGRTHFEDYEHLPCRIPPLDEEIALIRLLGAEVWAITLFTGGLSESESRQAADAIKDATGIPTLRPLEDRVERLTDVILRTLSQ